MPFVISNLDLTYISIYFMLVRLFFAFSTDKRPNSLLADDAIEEKEICDEENFYWTQCAATLPNRNQIEDAEWYTGMRGARSGRTRIRDESK